MVTRRIQMCVLQVIENLKNCCLNQSSAICFHLNPRNPICRKLVFEHSLFLVLTLVVSVKVIYCSYIPKGNVNVMK